MVRIIVSLNITILSVNKDELFFNSVILQAIIILHTHPSNMFNIIIWLDSRINRIIVLLDSSKVIMGKELFKSLYLAKLGAFRVLHYALRLYFSVKVQKSYSNWVRIYLLLLIDWGTSSEEEGSLD